MIKAFHVTLFHVKHTKVSFEYGMLATQKKNKKKKQIENNTEKVREIISGKI